MERAQVLERFRYNPVYFLSRCRHRTNHTLFRLVRINRFVVPLSIAEKVLNIAETAIKNGECYSLKTLKINGSDIIKLGYSGEAVGRILNRVLSEVRAGSLKNDRAALLKKAESYGRVGK